jgi:hypothetical protein
MFGNWTWSGVAPVLVTVLIGGGSASLAQAASITISGTITYTGEQSGPICVYAMDINNPDTPFRITNAVPGPYQISGLTSGTRYYIGAYRDSDTNGVRSQWEAGGDFTGNPHTFSSDTSGCNITITDTTSAEGLPYWWLWRYFGSFDPVVPGGSVAAYDSDGDGLSNWGEYKAGTDPTNSASVFTVGMQLTGIGEGNYHLTLSWSSIAKRTYALWRSGNLLGGFTKIVSGISPNVPQNQYEDTSAVAGRQYFYKVQVE